MAQYFVPGAGVVSAKWREDSIKVCMRSVQLVGDWWEPGINCHRLLEHIALLYCTVVITIGDNSNYCVFVIILFITSSVFILSSAPTNFCYVQLHFSSFLSIIACRHSPYVTRNTAKIPQQGKRWDSSFLITSWEFRQATSNDFDLPN